MTQHLHTEIVPGCYRCDLGRDESPILECSSVDMHGCECGGCGL